MTEVIATKERVYAACEQIYAEGKPVTQEKVRAIIGGGSFSTVGKLVKEWKEREDNDISAKSYPIPDHIKKTYEEANQQHWNSFCGKVELISNNEKIFELEKEIESLQDKLKIAEQDSIRLEELRKTREQEREEYQQMVRQLAQNASDIQILKNVIENLDK